MKKRIIITITTCLMMALLTLSFSGCKDNVNEVEETTSETMPDQVIVIDKTASEQLGDFAAAMCWPYGESDKGRYDGGAMNDEYRRLYDELRPQDDSEISGTQWNAGASCDLFVATAVRGFGIEDFPVTLATQCDYFFLTDDYKEHFSKLTSDGSPASVNHGDLVIYIKADSENNGQGHIFIVNKGDGHTWRSNAHYRLDNGYYGVTDDMPEYTPENYKYFGVFRLKDEPETIE